MNLILLTSDSLSEEDRQAFWSQDIDMDDIDYVILFPTGTLEVVTDTETVDYSTGGPVHPQRARPTEADYHVIGQLFGTVSYDVNYHVNVVYRGSTYDMGVRHH